MSRDLTVALVVVLIAISLAVFLHPAFILLALFALLILL